MLPDKFGPARCGAIARWLKFEPVLAHHPKPHSIRAGGVFIALKSVACPVHQHFHPHERGVR